MGESNDFEELLRFFYENVDRAPVNRAFSPEAAGCVVWRVAGLELWFRRVAIFRAWLN